jgi:hypothetical protein
MCRGCPHTPTAIALSNCPVLSTAGTETLQYISKSMLTALAHDAVPAVGRNRRFAELTEVGLQVTESAYRAFPHSRKGLPFRSAKPRYITDVTVGICSTTKYTCQAGSHEARCTQQISDRRVNTLDLELCIVLRSIWWIASRARAHHSSSDVCQTVRHWSNCRTPVHSCRTPH